MEQYFKRSNLFIIFSFYFIIIRYYERINPLLIYILYLYEMIIFSIPKKIFENYTKFFDHFFVKLYFVIL